MQPALTRLARLTRRADTDGLPAWARGALLMVVSAVGFAIMNACAKEASRRLPFLEVAFARALLGAVAVALWARARGISLAINNRRVVALRVTSGTVSMTLTFYALAASPLGEASALMNLTPIFVAGIGVVWLRERVTAGVLACLLLGLLGAFLVFHPTGGVSRGALAAIGAAATSALAMTSLRKLGATETSEAVVASFQSFGALVTGLLTIPVFVLPTGREAALLVVAGLSATIAQVSMTRAYAADVAARVGGMNYLHIVVSLLFGIALFGERPDLSALAGIAAILAAGGGLVWTAYRSRSAP